MATQNPIEQEGTYPLPEAQIDRFLMHVRIGYPDEKAEAEIVRLVRSEEDATAEAAARPARRRCRSRRSSTPAAEIDRCKRRGVEKYIVDLIFATRYPERYSRPRKWIQVGASPRGALALDRCSRVRAGSRAATT